MHATPGSTMATSTDSLSSNRLQRRLEHSLLALFAVAVCGGLTLMAARPLPAGEQLAAANPTQALTPHTLATPAALATDAANLPQPQRKRAHVRRSHQTLAMPYFSFAAGN